MHSFVLWVMAPQFSQAPFRYFVATGPFAPLSMKSSCVTSDADFRPGSRWWESVTLPVSIYPVQTTESEIVLDMVNLFLNPHGALEMY